MIEGYKIMIGVEKVNEAFAPSRKPELGSPKEISGSGFKTKQ